MLLPHEADLRLLSFVLTVEMHKALRNPRAQLKFD
jgi:hypothetical protein